MKQWYVVYTKPRNEKKVAKELAELGIEAYCPVKKEIRYWTDRKKIIETPLFTSYCFVFTEESQRNKVLGVFGISRFLYWLGKPAIIKTEEIEEIKKWLNDFSHDTIRVENFQEHEKVQIRSGAMMNQEGIVLSQRGNQLVLQLDSLGFKMCVSLAEVEVVKK